MAGLVLANLAATAAILFILLFQKIFIEKVYPKVFVLLWMLVILRILVPFEFSSGISLYFFEEEKQSEIPKTEIVFEEQNLPEEKLPFENKTNFYEKTEIQKAGISEKEILFFVWISGSVLTFCFFAAKHFYMVKKLLKNSVPFGEIPEEFKDDNIRFYKSKTVASPLSFGVFKPVIILPEDISEKHLPFVLLHEHTHIKDRDSVLKILALFALALNWFNPFVWFMVKMFERDIERYCDERVLKKLGGKNALSYANTILDFAERESLSVSFFSAASLCERVTSIMKNKNKKQSLFMVALVFSAVVFTMTACGTTPKEPEKEPAPAENTSEEAKSLDEIIQETVEEEIKNGETEVVEVIPEYEKSYEEIVEAIGYMSLEEITAAGYYPDWMQPYTKIVYDENGIPTVTEGGELLPEDLVGRPEFTVGEPMRFTSVGIEDPFFMIQPNTMAEYDLHGFIQNIYYLWPDGNYNLSPPPEVIVPEELIKVPEFLWPCEEKDLNAVVGSYKGHTGIDIGHTQGAEIYASRAGTVTETEWGKTGYGYYIVIDHGEGYSTLYAHCSDIFVKKGQEVKAGETIGLIGSTGNSTGTHLHFELHYKDGIIDPQNLLIKN